MTTTNLDKTFEESWRKEDWWIRLFSHKSAAKLWFLIGMEAGALEVDQLIKKKLKKK